ncbi:DNA repair protein RecN [Georgenia faecalis]|uniref:DNA repair protein RecN n=1 Tax=Georgenia faecalis TaxID=2483799 RepID=A0ABV9DEJ3_9MICO|nr:DNA repair protein RecN [Georgenia faecalis]
MIEDIRIENLGVIAAAHLELGPALTVITGETGAGKTMVLTGLGLLLGGRADATVVRGGADQAVVEGTLVVPPDSPLVARAEEAGALVEDGALLVSRTVPAQGRSRAHLGGRTVPQAVLAEIGEQLVTVHGQSDQLRLRSPSHQRAALDAFAGPEHARTLAAYRAAWAEAGRAAEELARWEAAGAERAAEVQRLRAGLELLEALDVRAGEETELKAEAERLGNVEELRLATGRAHEALTGSADLGAPDATTLVEEARRSLEHAGAHDRDVAALAERVAEAAYVLADVGAELGSYLASLEADPARLDAVHARRAAITDTARRLGVEDGDALVAWGTEAAARLTALAGPTDTGSALTERLERARAEVATGAAAITRRRAEAAERLAAAVDAELAGLAMGGATLHVRLAPLPEPGPWGAEDVELALAPHPGAPPRPLGAGASGGELSRVMLAIEVALAGTPDADGTRTFVFDEVDAGVGGRAAVEVGRRLARLARTAQVVVVTHLAQVAAFADTHLVVTKRTEGADTLTGVSEVTGGDRERELARMLSGQDGSDLARRHAAELMERAAVGR